MAAEIFKAISNLRMVLDTETDADSPDNETTYGAIRTRLEYLIQILLGTGDDGTATADPPNDTSGVLTDAAGGYGVDEHNGRTLLMTSGLAKGFFYTIDDTTATQLICTGDNLYADGVRDTDDYIVLYDIKTHIGHTHNAIDSPSVVLANDSVDSQHYVADSIDSEHYAPGSVDAAAIGTGEVGQSEIGSGAVHRGELDTGTEEETTAGTGNMTFSSVGSYGFFPQIKHSGGGDSAFSLGSGFSGAAYATVVSRVDNGGTGFAQIRYITASGEVHWLFIMRDALTKDVIGMHSCPDHCCFASGGNPELKWHPFSDIYEEDEKLYRSLFDKTFKIIGRTEIEILVAHPSKEQLLHIKDLQYPEDDLEHPKSFLEVIGGYFDFDDTLEPPWPSEPVTVGLQRRDKDSNILDYKNMPKGTKIGVIKKVIPKHEKLRTVALFKK